MSESEQERRGICCPEAEHTVVMQAYDLPMRAI
jgi:hypothetical protein